MRHRANRNGGRGSHPGSRIHATQGMRAGIIISMDLLYQSIVQAVNLAEEEAQETIKTAYVSISSLLCHSKSLRVELKITGHPIDNDDLKKVFAQAISSAQGKNYHVLHTLPLGYRIDADDGIKDPTGMYGDVLESRIHLMMAPKSSLRNLSACIEKCHLEVDHYVSSLYAAGLATLVEDELELGVGLLDIGAESTSIGIFHNNTLAFAQTIPLGGMHITTDIARAFSTPMREAERLKVLYGSALVSPADGRSSLLVPQIGEEDAGKGRQINKAELTAIIRPRVEELFEGVRDKLKNLPGSLLSGRRLVITGGGSLLPGIQELAALILEKQARIAKPLHINGLQDAYRVPGFSVCHGLLMYAKTQAYQNEGNNVYPMKPKGKNRPLMHMGKWLKENF